MTQLIQQLVVVMCQREKSNLPAKGFLTRRLSGETKLAQKYLDLQIFYEERNAFMSLFRP